MAGRHTLRWLILCLSSVIFIGCGGYTLKPGESVRVDNTNTVAVRNGEATILVTPETGTYPRLAHQAGIEGDIEIRVVTDRRGKPTEITVIRGVDKMLEHTAVEIVSNSIFTDSRRQTPVQGSTKVTVRFRLEGF